MNAIKTTISKIQSYKELQNYVTPDMTKERYETLTDKEKVDWIGIADAVCRMLFRDL